MSLDVEIGTYNRNLDSMLTEHLGQYVVIRGTDVAHFAKSYEGALDWAYERFGLDRFFVKRVSKNHDVAHFTRDLGPCRP